MSWFMPSYGRAAQVASLIKAPGGWPPQVTLVVNDDDLQFSDYLQVAKNSGHPFYTVMPVPSGSRCADAHRMISIGFPDLPFYGLLCDDQWPVTPGWWQAMEAAVEDRYVVTPAGERSFPLCRTAVCLGGGLVRAMGSLVPVPVKHNFEDNLWDRIAEDFKLLRPLPDYRVEHRHHIRGEAPHDATYLRGSADFSTDQDIYEAWIKSDEKIAMDARIIEFLKS